jgi:acetyl esterase/lipase
MNSAVAAILMGCASLVAASVSGCGATQLEVHRGLDVGGVTVTDVFAPVGGHDLPVVVMLHGTGGDSETIEPLARTVARGDVVVYVPSWPVIDETDPYPSTDDEPYRRQAEAVICSLRFARRTAPSHGGDPDRLTVFGHSGGATAGARVALVAEPLWPGIECDPTITHRPERFIATGGDFFGVYQDSTECPRLFAPYDPFAIEPSNDDVEVRLLHGYFDRAVDARVSQLFNLHLVDCGLDSLFIGADTAHSEMRDPTVPAGAFVADQIVALVHGRSSVFDRSGHDAVIRFTEEGACRYDGPTRIPAEEPLRIEIHNETAGDVLWVALARLRPEMSPSLAELRADRTSNGDGPPAFVSYGGFASVAAKTTELLDWVFVDADATWAIYCMRDPDPAHPMRWPSMALWGGPAMYAAAIISATD